jgi:protein-disulfide isomerase
LKAPTTKLMTFVKPPIAVIVLLALSVTFSAQTTRKRPGARPAPAKTEPAQPAVTAPATTPEPVTEPREPKAPIPVAVVNGQTITTADINPSARSDYEALDDKIEAARKQVLDLQINTLLLELEAKKRRVTSQALYDAEVTKRITEPTQADIDNFIAANSSQLDPADDLQSRVAGFIRANREVQLSEEFVQRLRKVYPVTGGVDINSPNLSPTAVVATVAGQPITAASLNQRLIPITYKLRANAYDSLKEATDQTINDTLLIAEANRRNIGPEEIIRKEVSDKVHAPTEAEVSKFYTENRERIRGDLDTVRNQLAMYLQEEDSRRLQSELYERLRKGVTIKWLISEPPPLVQVISVDDDPSRGPANAPVTIVEFTDFQCPACAAMHPVLDEVLKQYGDKVRFVVRDFPLQMHANARKAAEAANAANAQGKFFEYTDLLFKRQKALDVPSLKKYATELGLDRTKFDAALDSGAYAAEVRHDMQDGEVYGIESTPTIFINGVKLEVLSADGLRAAIDRALGGSPAKASTN